MGLYLEDLISDLLIFRSEAKPVKFGLGDIVLHNKTVLVCYDQNGQGLRTKTQHFFYSIEMTMT